MAARLYRVTGPVADWHSWRQSDTAAVARNFTKFGFDPFRRDLTICPISLPVKIIRWDGGWWNSLCINRPRTAFGGSFPGFPLKLF